MTHTEHARHPLPKLCKPSNHRRPASPRNAGSKHGARVAAEGVHLGEGAMDTLGKASGGDLRKAITTLQSAVRLKARRTASCLALSCEGCRASRVQPTDCLAPCNSWPRTTTSCS